MTLNGAIANTGLIEFDNDLRMYFVDNFSLSYDPIVDDIVLNGIDEVIVYILNETEYS